MGMYEVEIATSWDGEVRSMHDRPLFAGRDAAVEYVTGTLHMAPMPPEADGTRDEDSFYCHIDGCNTAYDALAFAFLHPVGGCGGSERIGGRLEPLEAACVAMAWANRVLEGRAELVRARLLPGRGALLVYRGRGDCREMAAFADLEGRVFDRPQGERGIDGGEVVACLPSPTDDLGLTGLVARVALAADWCERDVDTFLDAPLFDAYKVVSGPDVDGDEVSLRISYGDRRNGIRECDVTVSGLWDVMLGEGVLVG